MSQNPIHIRAIHAVERGYNNTIAFYQRTAKGPLHFLLGIVVGILRFYRNKIWLRFARNKEKRYTKTRVSAVLTATVLAFFLIPNLIHMGWQGTLMAFTMRTEDVYLTNVEEIDPLNEVHSVRGCRSLTCSESDTVYYRVASSWAHKIYSYTTRRDNFVPEEVAGVVAPGINRCTVTSYGIRVKALMRGWGIYPNMIQGVCTPLQNAQTPFSDPLPSSDI